MSAPFSLALPLPTPRRCAPRALRALAIAVAIIAVPIIAAPAQLAILKQFGRNKVQWAFVVNAKTAFDAKPAKGARVRILYHEEKDLRVADRVKILEAAPASSTACTSKTPASPSSGTKSPAAKSAAPAPAPKSQATAPKQ